MQEQSCRSDGMAGRETIVKVIFQWDFKKGNDDEESVDLIRVKRRPDGGKNV